MQDYGSQLDMIARNDRQTLVEDPNEGDGRNGQCCMCGFKFFTGEEIYVFGEDMVCDECLRGYCEEHKKEAGYE